MAETLDLNKLSSILDITNKDNDQIKECEYLFSKYKSLENFGPLLLNIACNKNGEYSNNVSLGASIQLKNYINSYWKFGDNEEINKSLCFGDDQIIVISDKDKNYIRNNILEGLIYIVEIEQILILKQFNQCVKKILKLDYKNIWNNTFIDCLIKCFKSKNQKIIYAGIMLLSQLSKLFQFEDKEQQELYNQVLIKINDSLLFFMNECKGIKNNVEALVVYKLVKIYFKSFQGEIPQLFKKEEVFSKWSEYIVYIIKTPLEQQYIEDKKNIFWKLKNVCFQTLTRIIQKYTNLEIKNKEDFQIMLENKYIDIYLEIFSVIYKNYNNNQSYVSDYGKGCIYGLFTYLLGKKKYKENVAKLFLEDNNLLDEIIKDAYMTVEDLETWVTDPKNYIIQKSQEINFFNTKRHKVLQLLKALLSCKKKNNYIYFSKVFEYICKSMINDMPNLEQEEKYIKTNYIKDTKNEIYLKNPKNIPYILKKESIIFLIKNNSEIIIKVSNLKDLTILLEKYILPGLFSPCGLLREQTCDLISKFGIAPYKNNEILENIVRKLCELMQNDPQLSVKLYASLGIGPLLEKDICKNLLKGNIKNIFEINLKLMEETDTEEIMDILQIIVRNFTEESQQYIVQLSDYLIQYFNKIVSKEDEDDKKYIDNYALETNIINTFCNIIECFINYPNIYPNIEQYIDKLLEYCFSHIYEKLEDGLDIIEAIIKYGNTIPNHVWKYFIPLIESIIGSKEELDEHKKEFPNQIFVGQGNESLIDITKIVSIFIDKDPNNFINMKDKKGVKYFDYVIKLIENIIAVNDSKSSNSEIKYSLILINTLFYCFKGKIDKFLDEITRYILIKYKIKNIKSNLEIYLQNLISNCFIYDSLKTLKIFQQNNCTKEIFIFWFKGFDKLGKIVDLKYNLFGICSLISIDPNHQDKLIIENINKILEKIYLITEKIYQKTKENENNNNNEEEIEEFDNNDENEINDKNTNFDEMIKNIIDGKNGLEDDEIFSDEEIEEDNFMTNFERQNSILFVKNILNTISQKYPDINKIIVESLGEDRIKTLNDIFNKEEQKLTTKNNC